MATLLNIIQETANKEVRLNDNKEINIASDSNYIKKSSVIVNDALQKGSDIMQMANGDILITEVKTVTYKYNWNVNKGRFERANNGNRTKRPRKNKLQVI